MLERETEEPNPDGTLTGSARFSEIPEDLQDQLKSLLKAVRKAVPSSIADKRKRDEIQHAILIRALDALASQYPTSISEDEQMLSDSGISERRRAAITVRLGEKRLIQEAKTYLLGLASDAAGTDESSAPSKKLRRSD